MANDDYDNAQTDREMSERFVEKPTHTPTPWEVAFVGTAILHPRNDKTWHLGKVERARRPWDADFHLVANEMTPEDARRIVACVNAMRDVSTEALERLVEKGRELELALVLSQSFGKE